MQSKNTIISALLQKYSSDQLTDMLLVMKFLAENRMLTPVKIKGLLSVLKDLNKDDISIKQSFSISASDSCDVNVFVDAVESRFSNSSIQHDVVSSEDIFVSVSGEGMSYKRSLDRDLDLLFNT